MIAKEIFGDMFKTDCQTLAIPVNTVGVMGKGLALYCKQRWPTVWHAYKKHCKEKKFREELLIVPIVCSQQILLLPTKNHWKEDSNQWLIEHSLKLLARDYQKLGITSLAIPKIGCGNGNMDFDIVRSLIYHYLDPIDIPVKIYT